MQPQRIALVTGARRGIGLATARALLEAGNRVVAIATTAPSKDLFPEEHHDRLLVAPLDITNEAEGSKLLEKVNATWGPLEILVNNAAISPKDAQGKPTPLMDVTREEWEAVLNVNVTSILNLSRTAVPYMKQQKWGRIINIASLAGRARSTVAGASYATSKAAVIGLTRTMANELGAWGITCNCVAPGRILTDMTRQGADMNNAYAAAIPLKRLGEPEEIAAVVAFLASEGSSYVTGAILDVNGGSFMA